MDAEHRSAPSSAKLSVDTNPKLTQRTPIAEGGRLRHNHNVGSVMVPLDGPPSAFRSKTVSAETLTVFVFDEGSVA
jgi:hypothetical protein